MSAAVVFSCVPTSVDTEPSVACAARAVAWICSLVFVISEVRERSASSVRALIACESSSARETSTSLA